MVSVSQFSAEGLGLLFAVADRMKEMVADKTDDAVLRCVFFEVSSPPADSPPPKNKMRNRGREFPDVVRCRPRRYVDVVDASAACFSRVVVSCFGPAPRPSIADNLEIGTGCMLVGERQQGCSKKSLA